MENIIERPDVAKSKVIAEQDIQNFIVKRVMQLQKETGGFMVNKVEVVSFRPTTHSPVANDKWMEHSPDVTVMITLQSDLKLG